VKKRNGRSKGFGFVEFENETDQLAALAAFDGATVQERQLNVKVALTAMPGQEEKQEEKGADHDAAASASSSGSSDDAGKEDIEHEAKEEEKKGAQEVEKPVEAKPADEQPVAETKAP
jgi:RNA recognition motif-containing protein